MAGQDLSERALARAVGPHDGVHLTLRTVREMPLRISFSPAAARRSLISSTRNLLNNVMGELPDTTLETHPQQLLGFHRELHRELLEDLLAEAVHDHRDRVLGVEAPLLAIEDLVFPDL